MIQTAGQIGAAFHHISVLLLVFTMIDRLALSVNHFFWSNSLKLVLVSREKYVRQRDFRWNTKIIHSCGKLYILGVLLQNFCCDKLRQNFCLWRKKTSMKYVCLIQRGKKNGKFYRIQRKGYEGKLMIIFSGSLVRFWFRWKGYRWSLRTFRFTLLGRFWMVEWLQNVNIIFCWLDLRSNELINFSFLLDFGLWNGCGIKRLSPSTLLNRF